MRVDDLSVFLVARDGGKTSARRRGMARSDWQGPPIPSGLGTHLVRVNRGIPAAVPALDAVRTAVIRHLESGRRAAARGYARMRSRYRNDIEPRLPGASGAAPTPAQAEGSPKQDGVAVHRYRAGKGLINVYGPPPRERRSCRQLILSAWAWCASACGSLHAIRLPDLRRDGVHQSNRSSGAS